MKAIIMVILIFLVGYYSGGIVAIEFTRKKYKKIIHQMRKERALYDYRRDDNISTKED